MQLFSKCPERNGSSGRTRTYNPPVNSRKEAISLNYWQLWLRPMNQCFVVISVRVRSLFVAANFCPRSPVFSPGVDSGLPFTT